MSKKVRLWPYKIGSAGCKELADALREEGLDSLRVRTDGGYRPKDTHLIINWGNGNQRPPAWVDMRMLDGRIPVLNRVGGVATAANKLSTFRKLQSAEVSIPQHTDYKAEMEGYLQANPGGRVYCRTKLSGHSGDGIIVARTVEELVDAPLYTVGINVKGEYRVHVFRSPTGEYNVIDVVKKRRRNEALDNNNLNRDIRNLVGGWVYAHNNVELPEEAQTSARKAVKALGLDFGAVDVVVEKNTNRHYILEVNSAPGLSSATTIAAYVNAIRGWAE